MDIEQTPFTQLQNPRRLQGGAIMLDAVMDGEAVTFVAVPNDVTDYGPAIYDAALAGEFGPVAPYVPPTPAQISAQAAIDARFTRNNLLRESDWTQVLDVPEATRILWLSYRQALRDISDQAGFPLNINWPVPPA
jgi:hypothetical protein